MYVKQLDVQSFRTFEYGQVQFSPEINVIFGDNGAGKTTILEALSFFAFGRSFRATQDKDVIQFGQTESRLRVVLEEARRPTELSAKITQRGKQVAVNRVAKKSLSEFLGHLYCVTFTPDDLAIVKEGPDQRRRFLNLSMAQYIPGYIKDLHLYNQLLDKRNQLLKAKQTDALPVWDAQMCEVAARVVSARRVFCAKLSEYCAAQYTSLSKGAEVLTIHYATETDAEAVSDIADQLQKALVRAEQRDSLRGFTSVGPHRDDLRLLLEDQSAARYSSQGQQRTIVLALKLAVVDMMVSETGVYPILLLDDVFSELDASRQEHLLSLLTRTQTVITATHAQDALPRATKAFRVTHGIMQEMT